MLAEIFEQPQIISRVSEENEHLLEEIVIDLKRSNITNVVIAARGTSDHAAIYGKYVIEYCLGIPVSLAAPSILTIYKKSIDYRHSLVIGISQSGQALDVLEVLQQAENQGAFTISITNFTSSPIAKAAKYHLYTNAGIEKSVAATKTFTSQLATLSLLAAKWSKNSDVCSQIKKTPDYIKKVLELERDIEKAVQKYAYIEDCFVLSRGINYAIALESALKIQETSYVKAKGYSISDFQHGPFAMIDERTPVLLYVLKGPSYNDGLKMLDKLEKSRAEIVLITDDTQLQNRGNISFILPYAGCDVVTPLFSVVFAQIFACKLAILKGFNPDSPRGLSKITITK